MSTHIEAMADYYDQQLNMPEVANSLRATAAVARKLGGPENSLKIKLQKFQFLN